MVTKLVKPVRHGDVIDLEIVSLAFGGEAVGRYQDFAVFVPGGLSGERAKVRITQVKDNYATGEILSLSQRSPDRVAPTCSIFEECGGCQWQHLSYPKPNGNSSWTL
jgi:23S rRNA (uracil1939-C5)-methyltransferase